jgi:hypothetical protein
MDTRSFSYTVPSSIEGEPEEVAALAKQQAHAMAAVVARLAGDTFVQLRSAGIDPDSETPVESWLRTREGRAAADFAWAARVFAEAAKAL